MKIDVLTLFPAMFAGPLDESIIMRARKAGLLELKIHNLRDWTHDRHKTVDDRPFGGGPGMLLKPEPIFEAVESVRRAETKVVLLSPSGRKFDQAIARELAAEKDLLLITGHYEGFDERVREALADDELSIGDYVLTNGALPAMVVIDAVTRLLPGVLGDDSATACWSIRNTPGRRNFAGCGCRTFWFPATTPRLKIGGASRPDYGRKKIVRIC
jgi:tRNA (guanine37-N1)-methyltransferase